MDHEKSISVDLLSAALDESGLMLDLNTGVEETHILNSDMTSGGIVEHTWDHITYPDNTSMLSNNTSFSRSVPQMPCLTTHTRVNHDQGLVQNLLLNPSSVQHLLSGNNATALSKINDKSAPVLKMTLPSSTTTQTTMSPLHGSNGVYKPVINSLTNKDVSRLWSNDDLKLRALASPAIPTTTCQTKKVLVSQLTPVLKETTEEFVEEEEEDLGHAETYSNYKPSKLKIGIEHPDSVVETSSLSSVQPPDIWYKLSIPESTIDYGHLSALQLEAMVYACQQHETFLADNSRAGFLIGDGAGVGKGRTIAGIIYENYLLGRKRSLWLSVSNDLKYDAQRDLKDIGAGKIDVHALNKFKYAKISSKVNGSVKKGVIFATYSSLIGESQSDVKYRTRLKQLLHWCGEDFDGVIVFDECHKAKNLCPVGSSKPTKTGQTVLDLQKMLPKARIVYASATGASEPKNMAYMVRLGIWGIGTPFREFNDFIQAVERRGVGAMEIVAMDIKLRGMYIARQLSFSGVTFKVEEVPLTKEFIEMYDASVRLWVEAREKFQLAADLIDAEHRMKKSMWGQFWSAHQRFFKYLCIASKVNHAVSFAKEGVRNGKCAVIGLQSTGEARTLEQLEESGGELNDFVSTAKGVFQTLIEKHFPAPNRKKTFDLFGLNYTKSENLSKSPNSKNNLKRKVDWKSSKESKRHRDGKGGNSCELKESDDSISDFNESSEDSDLSSPDSSESENESDFNPFGDGSNSDDDPWLNRKSKTKISKNKQIKKKSCKNKTDSNKEKTESNQGSLNNCVNNNINGSYHSIAGMDAIERAQIMKQELLDEIETIGDKLPPNTLDQLIDELGGPENVAEMTGRKGRIVSKDDGGISYESRSEADVPLETLNLTEKQRFMDGEKNIAIISEAASSGISLQADRRAKNQRRRVHITLELPWSADRAIQQFGRTHRSNQVNAPEYIFMISELAGERRFASIVAKRLESLGALTHGDRRATETRDLSKFNFDNKYGRTALEAVMKSVIQQEVPLIPPPSDYQGDFFADIRKALIGVGLITIDERFGQIQLDKDYNNMSKFLNRILGIQVEMQNRLFRYFTDTLAAVIQHAKRNGRWDMGILDLGSGGDHVKKLETRTFVGKFSSGMAATELHTVSVERGLAWEASLDIWRINTGNDDGYYLSLQIRNNKRTAILAVGMTNKKKREKFFNVYRPNTGLQIRGETLEEIRKKYKRVTPDEAQPYWQDQYDASATLCSHAYWRGYCKRVSLNLPCDIGLRTRTYHILSGSVLSIWGKVESVLAAMPGGHNSKMQIIRVKTDQGQRIVGTLIPGNCVAPLIHSLSQEATKTYMDTF